MHILEFYRSHWWQSKFTPSLRGVKVRSKEKNIIISMLLHKPDGQQKLHFQQPLQWSPPHYRHALQRHISVHRRAAQCSTIHCATQSTTAYFTVTPPPYNAIQRSGICCNTTENQSTAMYSTANQWTTMLFTKAHSTKIQSTTTEFTSAQSQWYWQ